jgi:hypothetical protein
MRPRTTITLAFLLSILLIVGLARSATAAPLLGTTSAPGSAATSAGAGACSLTGLVPARGSHCPDSGRLRRQAWGIPSFPNPVHIVKKVVGGSVSHAIKSVALAAILGWVASGAESALKETAKVIDDTTSPQLSSSWFSASYWRVAGIAALLTVPFLCAAAIHALVRSDLGLLARAAFGYLPLSLLAVGIASQLTMLLLAATDEMSSIVASASLHADGVFLSTTSVRAVAQSVATGDPFVTFLAAIITVAATLTLWLELLVRNAAVYVIVLMLPLFFAAMVWPVRRTLAIRAIETLIALILSKFAIVAVLSLGGAALGHSTTPGAASVLTGGTLVLLAAFTPWALLRMLPLHEVASAAAGGLSHAPKQTLSSAGDHALGFADASSALGAAWLGRAAARDAEPSLLEAGLGAAPPSSDRAGPEPGAGPGPGPGTGLALGADPALGAGPNSAAAVNADVARPVTGAMSEPSGGDGLIGPGTTIVPSTASDLTPGSEIAAAGAVDDSSGSGSGEPAADVDPVGRWPSGLSHPGAGGTDSPLPLGSDLLDLADQRHLPPAGAGVDADEASRRAAGPPSLAHEAPMSAMTPTQDPIGPPPADRHHSAAGSESNEPPTPRVPGPELGSDEFGEDR